MSIEGEVKAILEKLVERIYGGIARGIPPVIMRKDIPQALAAILKLTNPPLSEKEVCGFIRRWNHESDWDNLSEGFIEELSKELSAHFSKQIKYPEKKEIMAILQNNGICNGEVQEDVAEDIIKTLRKLNGEGV